MGVINYKQRSLKVTYNFHGMDLNLYTNSDFILSILADYLNFLKKKNKDSSELYLNFYLNEAEYINKEYFKTPIMSKQRILSFYSPKLIGVAINPLKNIISADLFSSCKLPIDCIFDLIFLRPLILWLKYHRLYGVHSSCISRNNIGILIPGRASSGKSTIAVSLVRNGFKFLSDEFPILRRKHSRIEALALPLKVGIRKTSIPLFSELSFLMKDSSENVYKKRFFIDNIYPGCISKQCEPQLLLFPQFKKNGKTQIKPISKKEALMNIIGDSESFVIYEGDSPAIRKQHFEFISFLVEQTKAYELFYTDDNIHQIPQIVDNLL